MDIDPRLTGGRRTGPDRKLSLQREVELIADYQNGVKLKVMETKYTLSKTGIYDVLERHGIETGGRKGVAPAPDTSAGLPADREAS
jgi:hypothetical protein